MTDANNTSIKFAIIGYGHIGQKHTDLILHQNSAELVAIADVKIHSVPTTVPFFATLEALLMSDIKFDVAIIATPNGLHAAQAIACLNAGKHVIIEKPIALTSNDAKQIFEVAEANGKHVFPVFQNRYASATKWLKKLLAESSLGDIYMVQVNCFWNRGAQYYQADHWRGTRDLDGGTLYTQFSHYIDILIWLFGPMENIDSKLFNFNHHEMTQFEDSGIVTYSFAKGAKGTLNFSTSLFDKNYESSILVIAEKGTVKIGGQYMDTIVYQHLKEAVLPEVLESENNHRLFFNDVVKHLQSHTEPPITAIEAVNVIKTIEEIYAEAKNN